MNKTSKTPIETPNSAKRTNKAAKTDKFFYSVCDKLRTSPFGIAELCAMNHASYADIINWISPFSPQYDHEKADYYKKATMDQKRYLVDSLLTLTEKMNVMANGPKQNKSTYIQIQVLKLRIETIKWFLSGNKNKKDGPYEPFPTDLEIVPYTAADYDNK